jgi:hypothetical protein
VGILRYSEYWIAGLFFAMSQFVRAYALRRFVAQIHAFRLRDVIGLNSAASLLNLVGPFRAGDLFRIFILSRKGLGVTPAIFTILVERAFDLTITLLFFGLLFSGQQQIFLFICLIFLIQLSVFWYMAQEKNEALKRVDFIKLRSLKKFISSRDLSTFFLSLLLSWFMSFLGVTILSITNNDILNSWILWNVKFGEPFTPLVSRNHYLIIVLLLPILGLLISTAFFQNSQQLARKILSEGKGRGSVEKKLIRKITSEYSGSGCEIYTGERSRIPYLRLDDSLMCKIETKSRDNFLESQASHMKINKDVFHFPEVYTVGSNLSFSYVVMENITDFSNGEQSINYAQLMSKSTPKQQQILIREVVDFLVADQINKKTTTLVSSPQLLVQRLNRVLAHVEIQLAFSSEYAKKKRSFNSTIQEVSSLVTKHYTFDVSTPSHGDATLSNFLRQETPEGFEIRAIDPNPRIPISRIEFDFGKVLQSTVSMYEDILMHPEYMDLGVQGFTTRSTENSSGNYVCSLLQESKYDLDFDLVQIFHLTHLIRILPYQLKHGARHANYWIDVLNYQFETQFK